MLLNASGNGFVLLVILSKGEEIMHTVLWENGYLFKGESTIMGDI